MNGTGHVPEPGARLEGLNAISTREIFSPLPPIQWLCQSLRVAPGAPTLFGGYGGSGKTMAAQSLCLAVASGALAWGRFSARRGRVLHLDWEQGRRLTSERYQRLAFGMDVDPDGLVSAGLLEAGIMPSVKMTEPVLCEIGDGRVLVLVDSWRAAYSEVDENSSEVRRTLDAMGKASERTGCTFVVLLHARKSSKDAAGGKAQSLRGSGGFYDGCQTLVLFEESGTKRQSIVSLERERLGGDGAPPMLVKFEDHAGGLRVMASDVEVKSEPTGAEKLAETMTLLRRLVPERPGLGGEALAEILGRRRQSVVAALQTLVAAGELRIDGTGPKRGFYPVTEVPFDV